MSTSLRMRVRGSIALLALCLLPCEARAEERDPAAAQALFDEAKSLVREGRYAEACPKLLESQRLDPGIGTQFNLADCYEKNGQIASAWASFLDVASLARASGQTERERAATKRAQRLEPFLPRIEIVVPESSDVPGLEIRRDGLVVTRAQWGSKLPVDPGEHEIRASAPGRRSHSLTLVLTQEKIERFEVPLLPVDPIARSTPPAESPPVAPPAEPASPPTSAPKARYDGPNDAPKEHHALESSGQRSLSSPWVLGLAGLGVAGLGVGGVYAYLAYSANEDSKSECLIETPNSCSDEGVSRRNKAIKRGNIATVGFAAGSAALAGAAVVWLLSGSSSPSSRSAYRLQPRAELMPGWAALSLDGRF